jgi:hypothetical protein
VGYFLRAKLHFAILLEKKHKEPLVDETIAYIKSKLSNHRLHLLNSTWRSLPELTNRNGEVSPMPPATSHQPPSTYHWAKCHVKERELTVFILFISFHILKGIIMLCIQVLSPGMIELCYQVLSPGMIEGTLYMVEL